MTLSGNVSTLKFTVDGRPTVEDIHFLFSVLMIQVSFSTHKYMFRSYEKTFTSEDALSILISHQFTTTCEEFSESVSTSCKKIKLNEGMAKALIQQFIWTRLIDNACDSKRTFKEKGIWKMTSKGLCILQEFCMLTDLNMNSIAVDYTNNSLMFLIHIERLKQNDRISHDKKFISSLFSIMIASLPLRGDSKTSRTRFHDEDTYSVSSCDTSSTFSSGSNNSSFSDHFPHIKTLPNNLLMMDLRFGDAQRPKITPFQFQQQTLLQNLNPLSNTFKMRAMFSSSVCCQWMVEYCTVSGMDEAESILMDFLKLGWITLYGQKHCRIESSESVTLSLTRAGMKIVVDNSLERYRAKPSPVSVQIVSPYLPDEHRSSPNELLTPPGYFDFQPSAVPSFSDIKGHNPFARLHTVLGSPQLSAVFRDFLSEGRVEYLDYWVDHNRFLKEFYRQKSSGSNSNDRRLVEDAYILWDTYLKPGTLRKLSIDDVLCESIAYDVSQMVTWVRTGQSKSKLSVLGHMSAADVLAKMLNWFKEVNAIVCESLATNSIPKFILTSEYLKATQARSQKDEEPKSPTPTLQRLVLDQSLSRNCHPLVSDIGNFPPPPPRRKFRETIFL